MPSVPQPSALPPRAGPPPAMEGALAVDPIASPDPTPEPPPPQSAAPETQAAPAGPRPASLLEVVALAERYKEGMLYAQLMNDVHLVHFETGRIEFRPGPHAPGDLANRLSQKLLEWTGERWVVSISGDQGEPTLREESDRREADLRESILSHPVVQKALETFPGAKVEEIRERAPLDDPGLENPDDSSENDEDYL